MSLAMDAVPSRVTKVEISRKHRSCLKFHDWYLEGKVAQKYPQVLRNILSILEYPQRMNCFIKCVCFLNLFPRIRKNFLLGCEKGRGR